MKKKKFLFLLLVFGSLMISRGSYAQSIGDSNCPAIPEVKITPVSYKISWGTGSGASSPIFRLVPIIELKGKMANGGEGLKDTTVFLEFYPDNEPTNASWHETGNNFKFRYPITHFEPLLALFEGETPFTVFYRQNGYTCAGLIIQNDAIEFSF